MSLDVIVRPLAEQDLFAAQVWYEEKRPGLGTEFRLAVDVLFQKISESPLIYPKVYRQLHRAAMRRFPYLIYYSGEPNRVLVVACIRCGIHGLCNHVRDEPVCMIL